MWHFESHYLMSTSVTMGQTGKGRAHGLMSSHKKKKKKKKQKTDNQKVVELRLGSQVLLCFIPILHLFA